MCVSHIILNNVKNNRFTWRKHYNEFLCGGIPSEMLSIVFFFFLVTIVAYDVVPPKIVWYVKILYMYLSPIYIHIQ